MCVMVDTAAHTALWWSLGQRSMTTLVSTLRYFTVYREVCVCVTVNTVFQCVCVCVCVHVCVM